MAENEEPEIPAGMVRITAYIDPGKAGFGSLTSCYVPQHVGAMVKELLTANMKG
jgi:hypothetical protein